MLYVTPAAALAGEIDLPEQDQAAVAEVEKYRLPTRCERSARMLPSQPPVRPAVVTETAADGQASSAVCVGGVGQPDHGVGTLNVEVLPLGDLGRADPGGEPVLVYVP